MALQVFAEYLLGILGLLVAQQGSAQRFADRVVPIGRLAVLQRVFEFDGFRPVLDGRLAVACQAGGQNLGGYFEYLYGRVYTEGEVGRDLFANGVEGGDFFLRFVLL